MQYEKHNTVPVLSTLCDLNNTVWSHTSIHPAGAIGAAGTAMATPVLGGEKWRSLEFIVMIMQVYHPDPASKPVSVLGLNHHARI